MIKLLKYDLCTPPYLNVLCHLKKAYCVHSLIDSRITQQIPLSILFSLANVYLPDSLKTQSVPLPSESI